MTFELRMLALSVVLDVQVVLASHAASQRGYLCTAGPRDEAVPR